MPKLSPQQIARIQYLATDEWVVDTGSSDDEQKTMENFQAALAEMSSIELHHFACNFNWDGGTEELSSVLNHPKCDAGTALLIFWLAQPVYYFRGAAKGKLTESERETYEWLKHIESRFTNNQFSASDIAIDPRTEGLTMGTDYHREYVDERMFIPTCGTPVEPLSF